MAYLTLIPPEATIAERNARWREYERFLQGVRESMPSRAYEFAAADWHYDFTRHECPHDAWVNSLSIVENACGERHEVRTLEIRLELLGAFHDGLIRITYPGVTRYSLYHAWDRRSGHQPTGHGDWLVDEVMPGSNSRPDNRLVAHEIVFADGGVWTIEAEDIWYEWLPHEVGGSLTPTR